MKKTRQSLPLFAALLWLASGWMASVRAQPKSEFHPLDLSQFYTTAVSNTGPGAIAFPSGDQVFNAVPFRLGGRLELTGVGATRLGAFAATDITGIPVQRKARRLHLLHGALHGQREGTPLANVVLHLRNGQTRALRLAFGIHARDLVEDKNASGAALADPNSRIAWERRDRNATARLFHTPLDNPQPEEEITTLDFVSLFGRATPVFFAVTLEGGDDIGPLAALPDTKIVQRATEFPDSAYRREMLVRVVDAASGSAQSNATAILAVADDARNFFFGRYRSDGAGKFRIAYPPQQAASMSLRVNQRGYAAESATFSALDGARWPEALEIRLQRGALIAGSVVDPMGAPISNAVVIPYEVTPQNSNTFTRVDLDVATTGADGKWQASAPTQGLARLSFEAMHPDYHSVQTTLPAAELLRGTAKMTLRPHLQIAGRVLNQDGQPVPRADVILVESDEARRTARTDASGRFKFIIPEPTDTPATLLVSAADYAPASQSITPKVAAAIEFKLEAGVPFSMRLTEGRGRPVADATVSLYRLKNQLTAFPWSTKTDSEGRFRWEHAPAGLVMFRFERPGFSSHYHSVTLPAASEPTYVWRAPVRLGGKVIETGTQKLVEQVRVRGVFSKGGSTSSYTTTGRKGFFSMTLSPGATDYTQFTLTIDAAGYESFSTNMPADLSSATNVYELKKAKMVEGLVFAPDGRPAPNTEVVLLDMNRSAYMDEPGKFRRSSSYYDVIVADEKGRFELAPRTNADLILAAHSKLGFVQIAAADFQKTNRIQLQPWGRVQGVLRVGDKVEPEQYAAIHAPYVPDVTERRSTFPLYLYYKMKPQPDGRFAFDAVPPGERTVQLRYMFSERDTGPYRLSHDVHVTVKPGETNDVMIGGTGRTVVGRVRIVGATDLRIDGRRGTFRMQSVVGPLPSEIPPPLIMPPSATPQERQRLLQAHQEKIRESARNRARARQFRQRNFFPLFDDDNNFRISNVPPGKYLLELAPYDPRLPTSTSRTLDNVSQNITVPEGTGPHDVGTVELKAR